MSVCLLETDFETEIKIVLHIDKLVIGIFLPKDFKEG